MMTRTRATEETKQWFASWFDSIHYQQLYSYRDDSEAAAFIDKLLQTLQPHAGSRVLDLGCGSGRHSRQLARRRLNVTGIDLSARSIGEAKRFETPGLRFRRHDMRTPFGTETFDYVLNCFTSFGYFDAPDENLKVVENIAASLRPEGLLILDYLNVNQAEAHVKPHEVRIIDGTVYDITRWSDSRNFHKRIVVEDTSAQGTFEYRERVAKFTLSDFRRMFALHGLRIDETYGDYELNPYHAYGSPRLILVVRRVDNRRSVFAAALGSEIDRGGDLNRVPLERRFV
jgi:SAM-dependent methyltransferase